MKYNNEDKHLCKTCKYHSGNEQQDLICYYIIKTGHKRPCDWRRCKVYEKMDIVKNRLLISKFKQRSALHVRRPANRSKTEPE